MAAELTLDTVWHDARPHVLALATRMLDDSAAAEDVAQEAFDRLGQADLAQIDDVRGWLAVVTRRLCLNRLRSAYRRRESTAGSSPAEGHEPVASARAPTDPADRVTLDEQVRLAMAIVLDRLSPAERTSFVLHDVFGFPYAAVGEIVGRTPAACRQLASRARRSIRVGDPNPPTPPVRHEDAGITERFIAACAGGDLHELMTLLDPDVAGDAVLLGRGPLVEARGAHEVASRLLGLFGPGTDARLSPFVVEGEAAFVAIVHGRLAAVVKLHVEDGVITLIHSYVRPPT